MRIQRDQELFSGTRSYSQRLREVDIERFPETYVQKAKVRGAASPSSMNTENILKINLRVGSSFPALKLKALGRNEMN